MLDILVVDDDEMVREPIVEALSSAGHRVTQASDGESALSLAGQHGYDLAVCDVRMPRLDGLTLLRRLRREAPDTEVVIMTSYAQIPDALGSLRDGAVDYITKPFDPEHFVRDVVGPIDERRLLRRKFERARRELASTEAGGDVVGMSRAMRELSHRLATVAASDCAVLITGAPGTGKKLLARTLHARSPRRLGPILILPCAALPDLIMESELDELRGSELPLRRDAWFRAAEGGTLVLDGVDSLPVAAQANVLRAIQEPGARARRGQHWEPLGVRIVALASQDLASAVTSGDFLGPLKYRLNTVQINVPTLRERDGDLYLLTAHFLRELSPPTSTGRRGLTPRAWKALAQHDFPGNVAELEAVIASSLSRAEGGEIDLEHLPHAIARPSAQALVVEQARG